MLKFSQGRIQRRALDILQRSQNLNQVNFRPEDDNQVNQQKLKNFIELLKTFKEVKFNDRLDIKKGSQCVICLEGFQIDQKVKIIPICKHVFHSECCNKWFKNCVVKDKHRCPQCNTELNLDTIKAQQLLKIDVIRSEQVSDIMSNKNHLVMSDINVSRQ